MRDYRPHRRDLTLKPYVQHNDSMNDGFVEDEKQTRALRVSGARPQVLLR